MHQCIFVQPNINKQSKSESLNTFMHIPVAKLWYYQLTILTYYEFTIYWRAESRSWRGVLDTILCDQVVNDLRQVGGFLQVLRLSLPIYLIWCWQHFLNHGHCHRWFPHQHSVFSLLLFYICLLIFHLFYDVPILVDFDLVYSLGVSYHLRVYLQFK